MEVGSLPSPTRAANGFFSSFFGSASASSSSAPQAEEDSQLPTLESRQTMLVVDLNLAPGETKTYRYTTTLPSALPPTFRGRALRFSYTLVIGTCRASAEARRQYSRVMKIPIRLYNHVAVGRTPSPYDLLWPVARRRQKGGVLDCVVEEVKGKQPRELTAAAKLDAELSLEEFASQLLHSSGDRDAEDMIVGCKEAVAVITRNPKKVSYDVTKNGVFVGELTFVKSAYRLGETITGVFEFNNSNCSARVLQLSVMLEAHESLPPGWLESADKTQGMRRVHAEHHEALIPCTARVSFGLNIPSDGAPEFSLRGGGGVAWKIRVCLLVAVGDRDHTHLVQDAGAVTSWAGGYVARAGIAPLEVLPRGKAEEKLQPQTPSWTALLSSPFGRTPQMDARERGREAMLETVECEVPVRVWPGNTAFKAADVVFDV